MCSVEIKDGTLKVQVVMVNLLGKQVEAQVEIEVDGKKQITEKSERGLVVEWPENPRFYFTLQEPSPVKSNSS